jgi:LPS-assembly protein
MRRPLGALAIVLALLAQAPRLQAQDQPASLVADSLRIEADNRLVAEGHVEVFQNGARLSASRITYDRSSDRISIEGPIRIETADGALLLADAADLSRDLQDGILRSARLVLGQQLQLASSEVQLAGGRYARLGRTVASSCKICPGDPTPLWEIRARSVVQDQVAERLYFEDASLRIGGVPVFFVPRLRLPSPGVERATGFLLPSLRSSTDLGTGLSLPYFITLGQSRDLTLSPFLATKSARTLGFRYRQAFSGAEIEVEGAVSRDEILPGENRGYLRAIGRADLPEGFELRFDATSVSDPGYLLDYDISEDDRLDSVVEVERTRRRDYTAARLVNSESLREDDADLGDPDLLGDITFHRRFSFGALGGEGGVMLQTHGDLRTASDATADTNGDGIADGRDTNRVSARIDWRRNWLLPQGLVAGVMGELRGDLYNIEQDTAFQGSPARAWGAAAAELRWPLRRASAGGGVQLLEPVAQLVWADGGNDAIPNQDSTLVEVDESSLFTLDRYPGADAVESGAHLNAGLGWTHYDAAGWSLGASAGRVFRFQNEDQFSVASGLDGRSSDWIAALRYDLGGLSLRGRSFLDGGLSVTKTDLRLAARAEDYLVAASYVRAIADPEQDRDGPTEEVQLDGEYSFAAGWSASALGRYDLAAGEPTRAGLGLVYRNECVEFDLSLSRRYTSSTNVQPSTDVNLSINLLGTGRGGTVGPARTCRR